jgi:hypothetical protein
MALASMPAMAQDHPDNQTYKQHNEWKAGSKIQQQDSNRGDKVDYRQNHVPVRQWEMSGARSMGIT